MKATLEYVEVLSPEVRTFWFKKPAGFTYIAGQFIEMHIPHKADERGDKHWFTLSSAPSQDLISITTKIVSNPSSFKSKLSALEPSETVNITDSMGDFVLPKKKDLPLLFVAGGIGITPFHSMLTELASRGEKREITLIYAARDEESLVFVKELSKICKVLPLLSEPSKDWTRLSGKLTASRILQLADIKDKTRVYLSGPEKMVEAITDELKNHIKPSQIITDYFPGYASL